MQQRQVLPAWRQQPLQSPSLAGLVFDVECSSSSACRGLAPPARAARPSGNPHPAVPPPRSARPRLHKVSNSHLLQGLNPVFSLPARVPVQLQPLSVPSLSFPPALVPHPHFSLSSSFCSPLAAAASCPVLGHSVSRERCRQRSHVWDSMGGALSWQEEVAGPGFTHPLLLSVQRRESSS